jgi:hypothetical protein
MQVVDWPTWLERHIPYTKNNGKRIVTTTIHQRQCLVVDPVDRNRRVGHRGFAWSTWEAMDNDIRDLRYRAEPVFLDNDTHQRWYWAFWDRDEALLAVIKLS